MKHIALLAVLALSGCGTTLTTTSSATKTLFAASTALDQAEVIATAYAKSPIADPSVVAEIKVLDNNAYTVLHPLVDEVAAGQLTASQLQANTAQTIVFAFADYLVQKGIH